MELKTPPVQEIFEQRGYLVLACYRSHQAGDIISFAEGGNGYDGVEGPMVIIAETDCADWAEQFRGIFDRDPRKHSNRVRYYRVVAE